MEFDTSHNIPELTVSEISGSIKRTVEDAFSYVKVRGEISGFKKAPSGHVYLSLKDDSAVLSAVCWKGVASRFNFQPEDGIEVICTGRITTYGGQSKYQLVIDFMEPAGIGALMAMLEKRKAQLAKEGLFEQSRKKPIPYYSQTIGIITSPTGAVIRDILHRIEERFPTRVLLWPTLVQGENAAEQIAHAIEGFNKFDNNDANTTLTKPDLLIVARGGGSFEDLWCFNEEVVVRAVADSNIPVISAVGHETDTTLIDYAADLRAPTPTAAAELATPLRQELIYANDDFNRRMQIAIKRKLEDKKQKIASLYRALPKPSAILDDKVQRIDSLSIRLSNSMPKLINFKEKQLLAAAAKITDPRNLINLSQVKLGNAHKRINLIYSNIIENKKQKLNLATKLLNSFHYKKVLARGFVLARDESNNLVKSASSVGNSQFLDLEFYDGHKKVAVTHKPAKKHSSNNTNNENQGSLF